MGPATCLVDLKVSRHFLRPLFQTAFTSTATPKTKPCDREILCLHSGSRDLFRPSAGMPRDDLGVTQKDAVAERRFAPCLPRRTENISKVHGEAVQDSVVGKMQSPEPTFRVGEVHPSRHHYGVRHPIRRRRSSGTNPSEGKRFFFQVGSV